jgi:NosR/NirI family nitrous oxide reductase transcriptional regulator
MKVPTVNLRPPYWLVRFWRLCALGLAAWLLHQQAAIPTRPLADIGLPMARAFFPATEMLEAQAEGAVMAKDIDGNALGLLVATAPAADGAIGYAGPSNLLVALDKSNRIAGIQILESADTPEHVEALRRNPAFAQSLVGWNPVTESPPVVQGVAGATLTGLAMVEGIALRLGRKLDSLRFPDAVKLEEVRAFFTGATVLTPDTLFRGWLRVADAAGSTLGYVVRTSPFADGVFGYAGPSESLVAVAPDRQTLLAVHLRKSYDTEEYVDRVRDDADYLKSLTRYKVSQWPTLDFAAEKIEGVAGATMTSFAVAEGLRERFHEGAMEEKTFEWNMLHKRDLALFCIVCGALFLTFSKWRGDQRVRLVWQLILIGSLGVWLGEFVSLGLLAGWARHGLPSSQAAPLLLLSGIALLLPWAARRQVYCHHLCAHGAAQEWLARLPVPKWTPPSWLHRSLSLAPNLLLAGAFLAALFLPKLPLNNLEPFDAWILGAAALVPFTIALIGLIVSLFIPMAHCKYGCATGALFGFVRSSSSQESFAGKDAAAAILLAVAAFGVQSKSALVAHSPSSSQKTSCEPTSCELRGTAFGTTWCIKLREVPGDLSQVRSAVAAELERIESTLSHWRPDSATSRFNASRSTDWQSVPKELYQLVKIALHRSRASDGAYDITVAPLVNAWGYGPNGDIRTEPDPSKVLRLLEGVGWEKLQLREDGHSLRKSHPELSLDLGSVLQGFSCDKIADILARFGCREFLVEVGGELLAKGTWTVAIENPADMLKPLQVLPLKDAALSTSGLARARRKLNGQSVSHIISPKTGYPVKPEIEVCSVQMPTCTEADGWPTTLIAAGLPAAVDIVKREGLVAWILDSQGKWSAVR